MMTIIESGQRYRFGEIRVSGPVQPGPAYLLAISEIEPGELYSEDAINSLENRLTIDGIYRLSARPALEFADSVCNIGLTLQLRRKPSVSGLIGLSPIPGSGKAGLSGDLRAFLPGLMNHGDLLDLRWTSPAAGSQELDVSLYYPYVAGFQWALRSSLKLKKIDTLYFNNDFLLGAIYLGNEKLRSGISWRYWSGAELNSGNMASRRQLLGFTLASGTYDESANPESGTRLSFSAETGYLSRQKGELNSEARLRLQSQFGLSQYIPVKGRLILHYHLNAALLAGDSLRTAEMYRIGGNRMLRGFDEEQFITSAYAITSCGLRYRADNITFAGLFLDLAVMNPESPGDLRIAYAPGIEAGIGSSNFMIILRYALGTEWSESIELSRGRLHIGLLLGVE